MTETIIPGTYIDVRAEGLISAGRVATGVVAVVGTASAGPVLSPITLAMPDQARTQFGAPDDPRDPEDGESALTLVRAIELCYANGASTVIGVRVAGSAAANASFTLRNAVGPVAELTALSPGTWANQIQVHVGSATEDCLIERQQVPPPFDEVAFTPVLESARNRLRVIRGATGRSDGFRLVYRRLQTSEVVVPTAANRFFLKGRPVEAGVPAALVRVTPQGGPPTDYTGDAIDYDPAGAPDPGKVSIATETGELVFSAAEKPEPSDTVMVTYGVGHADPAPGEALVTAWSGSLDFADGEGPDGAAGDRLEATYLVDRASCVALDVSLGGTREHYVAPDAAELCARVTKSSTLVEAVADDAGAHGRPLPVQANLGSGSNVRGANGAGAAGEEYQGGLDVLTNRTVNVVVLAGQHARDAGSVLAGHLALAENSQHERIGVIGAGGSNVDEIVGHGMSSGRIVVVAPAIRYPDGLILDDAYTAAAVAGLIASVSVQTSLTNKTLNVPDLALDLNRGEQAQLIQGNVLAVIRKNGFRVLRGLTSEGEGQPYSTIPIRRIVDYARYGVRSASDPYIGRLNNPRVRDALKATLDGFLTSMVDDEALTGYELNVFADRAQERRGEVSVVMTLLPTFSIEFVRVTMYLQ
ncbi:tail sheath protein [Humibacillus xanthopallidus]|uniref:Tail sheath protein n=2 Tax=Humibacillus xanthopallidus TaxID=412689 RepID=A0A543HUA0_9MICO|nr:tail sheath protein [Humibacillus xanthopallidus]